MKSIKIDEIGDFLAGKNAPDLWVIAQKKWTMQTAQSVLEAETKIRAAESGFKADPRIMGTVFLQDISLLTRELLKDCDRVYIFNQRTQIQLLRSEDAQDEFFLAEVCGDSSDEEMDPLQINAKMNEYRFASLLGCIPDAKISIRYCQSSNQWRFYHE